MGRQYHRGDYKNIVFLGYGDVQENPSYKTLLVNYLHSHKIYWVDLSSSTELHKAEFAHSKFLMQRYNLIEKAKEDSVQENSETEPEVTNEEVITNIFDAKEEFDEDDDPEFAEALVSRNKKEPYLIHINEFMDTDADPYAAYDKIPLVYYSEDDTLCDEKDVPIPDVERLLGSDALTSFGKSCFSEMKPVRTLWALTRAWEQSIRSTSCSRAISRLKTAVGIFPTIAACSAMFRARLVFPIEGRAAMMIRSEGWNPAVCVSRSV